ncbi:MAG: hypothetical protein WDZ72_02305 [Cyclobacteriaceae bacterium]
MSIFQFTLVLKGVDAPSDDLETELFEFGADDGLLYFRDRTAYLDFEREGESFEAAILSAILQVEDAGIPVSSVEPGDLVTAAEIARRLGRSKESVRLLISGDRGKGTFPVPVAGVTSKTKIWRWTEVLDWMVLHNRLSDKQLIQQAYTIRNFNESFAIRENPTVYEKAEKLVERLKRD